MTQDGMRPECLGIATQGFSLADLSNSMPIAMAVIGRDHRVLCWNAACEHLTGVKAREVVGTTRQWVAFSEAPAPTLADLVVEAQPGDDLQRMVSSRVRPVEGIAGGWETDDPVGAATAQRRWLRIAAAPLRNADGAVVAALATFQDITPQRRAESQLRKALSLLESSARDANVKLAESERRLDEARVGRQRVEHELAELADGVEALAGCVNAAQP